MYNIYLTTREFDGGPFDRGDGTFVSPPFRAHYLHEFGHAFGLAHEHQRSDATCPLETSYDGVYVTDYDQDSVMHYTSYSGSCRADGNYSNNDLSASDRLAIEVLYPANDFNAVPLSGGTLFSDDQTINLGPKWTSGNSVYLGAGNPFFFSFRHTLYKAGVGLVSTSTEPSMQADTASLGTGVFEFRTAFSDVLSRGWSGAKTIRIVPKAVFAAIVGSIL